MEGVFKKKSFANVTKPNKVNYNKRPSKELAIVINTDQNINTEEYVYTIGDIVGGENITDISKLYNHRLALFFNKKELVDKMIQDHATIIVGNEVVEVRRYINPAIRIVISNVCPSIPNEVIEESLKNHGLILISEITILRAGLTRPEYRHILTNRRQVLLPPNFEGPIPNSIEIIYQETKYRIYLSSDIICFKCKEKGYTAILCPKETESNNNLPQQITSTPKQTPTISQETRSIAEGKFRRNY